MKYRLASLAALAAVATCAGPDKREKQLTVNLQRAADSSAGSVTLEATVKNVSNHDVFVGVEGPLIDYSLTVRDCGGHAVPLSKRGEEVFSKDHVRSRMAVLVTLQPGETRVDKWSIDEYFEFVRPGCYTITAHREFETAHESISSNAVMVQLP